jgi:hypothetical protein
MVFLSPSGEILGYYLNLVMIAFFHIFANSLSVDQSYHPTVYHFSTESIIKQSTRTIAKDNIWNQEEGREKKVEKSIHY